MYDGASRMTIPDLSGRRIGVVLCGGGAKGAYHIGCWKALRAAGLDRVQALSGSSVGAINAVFIASGRVDAAEDAWRSMRVRDIVNLRTKSLLRLPLWVVAALGSEFSPFKITRLSDRVSDRRTGWVHAAVCVALSLAIVLGRGFLPASLAGWAVTAALIPPLLALLALAHRVTRPVFLQPVLTDNAPLARTLADSLNEDDLRTLRKTGMPIYGVVSHYAPGVRGAHRWGGWAPMYLRLDQAESAAALQRVLLMGSAVPGFLPAGHVDGRLLLDGSWTDNIPAGPLLFGGEAPLDIIFVVYLKPRPRHTLRPNSLLGLLRALAGDAVPAVRSDATLLDWAQCRWETHRAAAALPVDDVMAEEESHPLVVPVAPSKRVGNFFTGTLWFSKRNSAALIDLGERDMRAALERIAVAGVETAAVSPSTLRDTRGAAPRPGLASLGLSIRRAFWPWPEPPGAE
jgi:predicted acylesterase/phospholipase RssA